MATDNSNKTVLEKIRDNVHEAVKTEKIEERVRDEAKSGLAKAKDNLVGKVGSLTGGSEPEEPEGDDGRPPDAHDDNVFVDAAKILHYDISKQAEKAAEKIYEATEPPEPKK